MRAALAVLLLAASSPAFAQPRCEVHILRAPDAARTAIDNALRNQTCTASLVVRVIPTEKGLYLLAETPTGRTFERIVVDARTAAAAVKEWAHTEEPAPALPSEPLPPAPYIPTLVATEDEETEEDDVEARPAVVRRAHGRGHWFGLGGVLGDRTTGLRLEADLLRFGGFAIGVSAEMSGMRGPIDETPEAIAAFGPSPAALQFSDARAMVTAGYTVGRGSWRLLAQVGAGVMRSHMTGFSQSTGPLELTQNFASGEAGMQLIRTVGARWAITAGPLMTVYHQSYVFALDETMLYKRTLDVAAFAAIKRRL
jgi:hypothetical protein